MTDLTWIASYPRSGNTWLRFLIANSLVDAEFDWLKAMKSFAFELGWYQKRMARDGWTDREVFDKIRGVLAEQSTADVLGGRIFFKTHLLWSDSHPFANYTKRAVLLIRDPRDVLLSGLNFARLKKGYEGSDLDYVKRFIEHGGDPAWIETGDGTWAAHLASWTVQSDFPVHVVKYEEIKSHPQRELTHILEFLDLPIDASIIETAAERVSISKLRTTEVNARARGEFRGLRDGYYFINKGESGQSLDAISSGLDQLFEECFAAELSQWRYSRSAT